MLQEVLVSPTAKLDISKLLKSSPSPSPPPPLTSSHPSLSRTFSIPSTDASFRPGTTSAASTNPRPNLPFISSSTLDAPRRPSIEGQGPVLIPAISTKRTAPTSPQESRQANKKSTRQWSEADSDLLLRLRGDHMKWDDVAKHFPGRTNTACRLRYQNYLERKYSWTDEKKAKLARLYDRHDMWDGIAKELQIPWRAVEDMHWQIGQWDMANLAGARLLHPDRAGDEEAPTSPSMQSVFPPSGPYTSQSSFMATPAGTFTGLPPTPGQMLAQPPPPPTTNGTAATGLMPSGEETGFGFRRRSRRRGSSGGPLPSLAELNLPVTAYAPPGGGRYHRGSEEEVELDD
ncbi:MAG: hypothetical protein Q9170_000792 [Blastenia crenularia]